MTKKKLPQIFVLLLVLILMVFVAGCGEKTEKTLKDQSGQNFSQANDEVYKLRFISSWGQSSASWQLLLNFQKQVEEITDGKVKIDIVGGPEVFPATDQLEAVRSGAVDGAFTAGSAYSGYIPEGNAIAVSPMSVEEQIKSGGIQLLRDIHAKQGVFFLMPLNEEYAQFVFMLKKPIKSIDEMKGLRIRSSTGVYGEMIKATGATSINIPAGDTYSALEQGLVDGVVGPTITGKGEGLFDFVKYVYTPGWFKPGYSIIINQDAWNKIPSDVRELLDQNTPKIADALSQIIKKQRDINLKDLTDKKGQVLELSSDEAEKLEKIANEVGWTYVKQKSPSYGTELEKKLAK